MAQHLKGTCLCEQIILKPARQAYFDIACEEMGGQNTGEPLDILRSGRDPLPESLAQALRGLLEELPEGGEPSLFKLI